MARKKKELLALPAQAGQDLKTVSGIVAKWTKEVEELVADIFEWGKKHKFLVALGIGLLFLKRYWLDEQEEEAEDEDY